MRVSISLAMYAGEFSSVQRPDNTASGLRCSGLKREASDTAFQKVSSAALAPSTPPCSRPLAMTAAFIAPAEVPEMPSICSQGSSISRSSTPQVKAPWAPPPCSARSMSRGLGLAAGHGNSQGHVAVQHDSR